MSFNKNFIYTFLIILYQLPVYSAFAYTTDRSLISYFSNNILWRLLVYGGYYSLGAIAVSALLALVFKSFRVYSQFRHGYFCNIFIDINVRSSRRPLVVT